MDDETSRRLIAQLATGDHGYATDGRFIFEVGGRVLSIRLDERGRIAPMTLLNPFMAVITREKLVELLAGARELTPVPATVRDDLPALAAALTKTRAQIIDEYIARIRGGMTISGGPTTDQSWTVSFDGSRFTIAGYEPDTYERRVDPLDESELRRMLSTYTMFGLAALPA